MLFQGMSHKILPFPFSFQKRAQRKDRKEILPLPTLIPKSFPFKLAFYLLSILISIDISNQRLSKLKFQRHFYVRGEKITKPITENLISPNSPASAD